MQIFNSLSGKKEEFRPRGSEVTMYVCGINPYSDSHIGHAMSYIIFDVVRRYLEYRGYRVKHVENVTDVEDNIIATANRLGIPVKELTDKYTDRYNEDMDNLNVMEPHRMPKATETIPEIVAMTQGLIKKGFAYATGGNVYFRVRRVPDYGKLSKRSLDQMMAGARIETGEAKEDPMDFVLWKAAKPDEPSWDSPWGQGRPGWHIECSAMSLKYLGEQIDIHGGGQDLVFPHHENEIAQSESFTRKKPFVKYWMHNGLLQMGTDKMSKSIGNLITIRDALQKYSADAIRVFILSSYYRSPLTYSEETLDAAAKGADRLSRAVNREDAGDKDKALDAAPYRKRFEEAMDDDFNTPQALADLFDLARDINQAGDKGISTAKACEVLKELGSVLGLTLKEIVSKTVEEELYNLASSVQDLDTYATGEWLKNTQRFNECSEQVMKNSQVHAKFINSYRNRFTHGINPLFDEMKQWIDEYVTTAGYLNTSITNNDSAGIVDNSGILANRASAINGSYADLRKDFRQNKEYQDADEIRHYFDEMGMIFEDTPKGTNWKRKRG